MNDLNAVVSQLQSAGLLVEHLNMGKFTRCKVEGDKGTKQSGWYVVHEYQARNGLFYYCGVYGNWKFHDEKGVKIEPDQAGLQDDEREAMLQRQRECQAEARREKAERQQNAAKRANAIWPKLPEEGRSPYLDRKQVFAYGLRFSRGSVVLPVRSMAGALVGLQFIGPDGDKKFLTGTAKEGAFHLIGDVRADSPVVICEGYATGASIHRVTGWPVFVAFDANNLKPVALAVRGQYPEADLIIAGDNDVATSGNPGVKKANEAANAVKGVVVVPEFNLAGAA